MPSSNLKARMYFEQGRQGFATGDFDAAADHFRRAVQDDPQYEEAQQYLAESYEKLGYQTRARRAWEAALRITKNPARQDEIRQRLISLK